MIHPLKDFWTTLVSNLSTLGIPDEGYFRNGLCVYVFIMQMYKSKLALPIILTHWPHTEYSKH